MSRSGSRVVRSLSPFPARKVYLKSVLRSESAVGGGSEEEASRSLNIELCIFLRRKSFCK